MDVIRLLYLAGAGAGWDAARVARLCAEYARFIRLHSLQCWWHHYSPAPLVDAFWHQHLLSTASYEEFCAHVAGRFVHHDAALAAADAGAQRARYRRTLIAYRVAYGADAPAEFWPPAEPPLPSHAGTVQVFVKTLTGKTLTLDMRLDHAVGHMMDILDAVEGVPADQQRLIFSGLQLESARTLADYGVARESTVHLVLRLGGC